MIREQQQHQQDDPNTRLDTDADSGTGNRTSWNDPNPTELSRPAVRRTGVEEETLLPPAGETEQYKAEGYEAAQHELTQKDGEAAQHGEAERGQDERKELAPPDHITRAITCASANNAHGTNTNVNANGSSTSAGVVPVLSSALATPVAEAVCDLDSLPVGPGAEGSSAQTFSLSISIRGATGLSRLVKGATGLSEVSPQQAIGLPKMVPQAAMRGSIDMWLSYSIFGVVIQTDRFHIGGTEMEAEAKVEMESSYGASRRDGLGALEPMLDSFRLRATLEGLCEFLGEAPPLQVGIYYNSG